MSQTVDEVAIKLLLDEIAQGDQRALDKFYHQFKNSVYRFALSRLHDAYAAEDILSDVMMQVWNKSASFDGRSKVNTWLLGITHHKIIDYIRKESRHSHDELDTQTENISIDTSLMDNDTSESIITENMTYCIDELKDSYKEIMYLTLYADLSYQDISAMMDCPEGTIKSRMFSARKLLKKCLSTIINN